MSRDGNRRRGLSDEERVLWTTVSKAIKPLRARPQAAPDEAADSETDFPKAAAKPARPASRAATALPAAPPKPAAPPLAPQLTSLGRRLRARVARGKERIDARLDLHGLTQAQAHDALLRFLRNAHARDARLVLVITGKGLKNLGRRSDGERGVLKRQVPQWLGLPEFRALVVGFEDAHLAHGGKGALYVRVRKARSE